MKKKITTALLFLAFFMAEAVPAYADLMISPLRVVFEGRDRSSVVTLINTTNEVKTYRMGWTLLKVTPNGQYEEVEQYLDANGIDRSADDMIRFSPRQVTIEPQGRQRIRLSLRRPADLTDGEYRAHLNITNLSTPVDTTGQEEPEGATIAMQVNLSFTIPVIVRQGKAIPEVSIANPQFMTQTTPEGEARPQLVLSVEGENSLYSPYGRMRVFWRPDGAEPRQIGILNNVALYPEIDRKFYTIDLEESNLPNGSVQVVYEGTEEYEGVIFDNKTFPIQ